MAMLSLADPYADAVNLTFVKSKLAGHSWYTPILPQFRYINRSILHLWQVLILFGRNQVYEGRVHRAQTVFRQLNSDSEKHFLKNIFIPFRQSPINDHLIDYQRLSRYDRN